MNTYAILPMVAFFTNVILGCYILYRDPKERLNRLYALVAFALAIWSLGDFLVFTSLTPDSALYWDKLSTSGSILVPVFLLHFFLVFTKNEFVSRKIFYLLYIPALLFGFVNFTTTLISGAAELNYWGYGIAGGVLYAPFVFYIIAYVIAGLLSCYSFYSKIPSVKEKIQAELLIISIAIPLVGGVTTEAVPIIFQLKIIPLTSALSTITAVIIAYTIIRYKLMTPISFSIGRKLLVFFVVLALLMGLIGYAGIYTLNGFDVSTKNILEKQQPILTKITQIKSDSLNIRLKLDQYMSTGNKAHSQTVNTLLNHVNEELSLLSGEISDSDELKIFNETRDAFDSYRGLINSLVYFYEQSPDDKEMISVKKIRIDSLLENALLTKLDSFYSIEQNKILELGELSHETYNQSFWIISLLSIALIGTGGLVSFLISRSIANPLIKMAKIVPNIARGEFDQIVDVRSKDEIGELASAFNQMAKDMKTYQDQIKKHGEDLEKKVAERTKELDAKVQELTDTKTAVLNMMEDTDEANKELIKTHDELKESLEELKKLDVRKDEFISIAAHELKTPLTSIHGFSQLLQNREVAKNPEKREKYLKIMDSETKRLAKLVTDILDLSRIDLGTLKLNFEEVEISRLMEDMGREMNVQMKEKGLESEYDLEKGLPGIMTDKERLTEILLNLINNAIKYTPKGKITVKVFRENDFVHFTVKDTGIGIEKEYCDKLFHRFYQIDSSYTRKAGGTGLGLALCREFVTLLGGKIWLESEPGKGSEFHFTIPIKSLPKKQMSEEKTMARERLEKSENVRKKLGLKQNAVSKPLTSSRKRVRD